MFVKIVDFLACLPPHVTVQLDFTFCSIIGQAGRVLEDDLFQEFDFSEAVTNNIHHVSSVDNTIVISVYAIHKEDYPSD